MRRPRQKTSILVVAFNRIPAPIQQLRNPTTALSFLVQVLLECLICWHMN